jgi:hypothetical protein
MKIKKILLGLFSAVLLSLGLVRLAAATDPLAAVAALPSGVEGPPAPECTFPCSID